MHLIGSNRQVGGLWAIVLVALLVACGGDGGPSGPWTSHRPMPTARFAHAVVVVDGVLYAIGGDRTGQSPYAPVGTVEAFDPAANNWVTKAPMPTPRAYMAAVAVDGIIYAIGGIADDTSNGGIVTGVVEAYNPATNTWTSKAPMPTPRGSIQAGVVNGLVYVPGGSTQTGDSDTLEIYNPETNGWTGGAAMPLIRQLAAVGSVNGLLYVVGGCDPTGCPTSTVQRYDPISGDWSVRAGISLGRFGAGIGALDSTLVLVGGLAGVYGHDTDVVEALVGGAAASDWVIADPMPTRRAYPGVGVVGGRLWVVGGLRNVNVDGSPQVVTGVAESYAPEFDDSGP